jgi:ribulose-5-phosphate 4-epimerase/fuculose-1-phosphate aldolase
MTDEGYIKFNCTWIEEELPNKNIIDELNNWRQKLYNQQLIGAYPDGIGYGSISCRLTDGSFLITGTATGNIKQLTNDHFTRVVDFNIEDNSITCQGPIKASSESLTHAIIYKSLPEVNAVVHIHNNVLWQKLLNNVPTTSLQVAYGTPEMANEINRLRSTTNLKDDKILVMAGHEDGLIAFGKDLAEAAGKFLA